MSRALPPWLADVMAECEATWPGLSVAPSEFAEFLLHRIGGKSSGSALKSLRVTDVYLAFACGRQDPQALAAFDRSVMPQLEKTMARLGPSGWQQGDAAQLLRIKLFTAQGSEPPAVMSYSGSGSLVHWARAVATRMLLDLKRKDDKADPLTDSLEQRLRAQVPGADEQTIAAELGPLVQASLKRALKALSAEQRAVLKLHFVDGLSFEQIGRLQRVHRATALRRVSAAHEACFDFVRDELAATLHLKPWQLQSLINAARSHIEVSLSPLLSKSK